jgi:hypothetical protein
VKKIPLLLAALLSVPVCLAEPGGPAPSPNGITQPPGYQNWRVIGVSERSDNGSLRAILGNAVAIEAARTGHTNPWPDGTMLAKVAWKQSTLPKFPTATVPGEFVHTDLMVKDSAKYAATGGWGYARWVGTARTPYGKDAGFAQECFACHSQAADTDRVFTRPAPMP